MQDQRCQPQLLSARPQLSATRCRWHKSGNSCATTVTFNGQESATIGAPNAARCRTGPENLGPGADKSTLPPKQPAVTRMSSRYKLARVPGLWRYSVRGMLPADACARGLPRPAAAVQQRCTRRHHRPYVPPRGMPRGANARPGMPAGLGGNRPPRNRATMCGPGAPRRDPPTLAVGAGSWRAHA